MEHLLWIDHEGRRRRTEDFRIGPGNRAFRYGDGLFESIRISKGRPLFFPLHYSRFILGLQTLRMEVPDQWQPAFLRQAILDLTGAAGIAQGRLRMTCWRTGEGLYSPQSNQPDMLLELAPLQEPYYRLNLEGLNVDLAENVVLAGRPWDRVKSANAMTYVLAAMEGKERGLGDLLLTNAAGRPVEAVSSNLFLFKEGRLSTPPESEGGVPGVMRRVLIKIARRQGIDLEIRPLDLKDLFQAEELFLTNAVTGIRWVARFRDKHYTNTFVRGLFSHLEEKVLSDLSR